MRLLLRLRRLMKRLKRPWSIPRLLVRTLRLLVLILGLLVQRLSGLLPRRRWRVLSLPSP